MMEAFRAEVVQITNLVKAAALPKSGKSYPSNTMQHRRVSVQQVSCALSDSRRMNESQENPPRKRM
jgi:hypothetical protein